MIDLSSPKASAESLILWRTNLAEADEVGFHFDLLPPVVGSALVLSALDLLPGSLCLIPFFSLENEPHMLSMLVLNWRR